MISSPALRRQKQVITNSPIYRPIHVIFSSVNSKMEYKIEKEEETPSGAKIKASCIFQKLYVKNANGMHMGEKCLSREINAAQEDVRDRHFIGELDHPENLEDTARIATVQLKNASHVVTRLEIDGNYVVGDFETLTTVQGLQLRALLSDKIKVGVSIRALTEQDIVYDGSLNQDIDDFNLVSYDAVHSPAFHDAYVTGILSSIYKIHPRDVHNLMSKGEATGDLITLSKSDLKELVSSMVSSVIKLQYKKLKAV